MAVAVPPEASISLSFEHAHTQARQQPATIQTRKSFPMASSIAQQMRPVSVRPASQPVQPV
jgi:hypothetical protein